MCCLLVEACCRSMGYMYIMMDHCWISNWCWSPVSIAPPEKFSYHFWVNNCWLTMKMKRLADSWFLLISDGLGVLICLCDSSWVLRCSGLFVILLEVFVCMWVYVPGDRMAWSNGISHQQRKRWRENQINHRQREVYIKPACLLPRSPGR